MITQEEFERRMRFSRERVGLLWTLPETSHKEMDVELAEAFAKLLTEVSYRPNLGCATTQELIREIEARVDLNYKTVGDGDDLL